jgi:hypothetical protein
VVLRLRVWDKYLYICKFDSDNVLYYTIDINIRFLLLIAGAVVYFSGN